MINVFCENGYSENCQNKKEEIVYILDNGTSQFSRPNAECFFIEKNGIADENESTNYFFEGDEIFYSIDELCVNLYDLFRDKVFPNGDYYCEEFSYLPQGITDAGHNAESQISKKEFKDYFEKPLIHLLARYDKVDISSDLNSLYCRIDKIKYKHAYLSDCQQLISTLQDLIIASKHYFLSFYLELSKLKSLRYEDGVYYASGGKTQLVVDLAQLVFVKVASALDILTKICYELEHLKCADYEYPKLACKDVLYSPSSIRYLSKGGTIFEKDFSIQCLLSIRNEVVHNSSWDNPMKVYYQIENNKVIKRYVLMPDLTIEGTLDTYKNRRHFFSSESKLNEQLPNLYLSWLKKIYTTLSRIMFISN